MHEADRTEPPSDPAEGERYIVPAGATGAWSGQEAAVAAFQDGDWSFLRPAQGWLAWIEKSMSLAVFRGGLWQPATLAATPDRLGVNASADEVNRLSVASAATLLNHDGHGHQLKLNKAASGETASLLFQTGFSRRAEMGTAGDDDFRIKISADGSSWRDAIVIAGATGAVRLPNTRPAPSRERLVADRVYHVRADGSDANDGLADTPERAWRSVQHAIDSVYGTIDLGPHHVTIQLGDGVYNGSILVQSPHVGAGTITLAGNATAPQNTIVARTTGAAAVMVTGNAVLGLRDLELRSNGNTLIASLGGQIHLGSGLRFAVNANGAHMLAQVNGLINASNASYTVLGNAAFHWRALLGGIVSVSGARPDVTGRAFSGAFAQAERLGMVSALGASFNGTATGKRYVASLNGLVFTGTGDETVLPGSAAGTVETGGWYG